MEENLKFDWKWKTTSSLACRWKMSFTIRNGGRQPQIFVANGRQPKSFVNRRQPQFLGKQKMTLIYFVNGRQPHVFQM